MTITLETHATEKSTFIITASFKDAAGSAVVPNSVIWTLSDKSGIIVNDRSGISETPGSSIDIVLFGNDLAIQDGETNIGERVLTIEATYNSTEGSNLPLKAEVYFIVDNLKIVTNVRPYIYDSMAVEEYISISIA